MKDNEVKNGELCAFVIGIIFGGMLGAALMGTVLNNIEDHHDELCKHAVEHGYAKYELDETTGKIEFKWKEKE